MNPGLHAEDIVVRFGGLVAVDHVSLSAPPGRITGLIGPNGAGKTTLFNACCGLVPIDQGTITLAGRDITRASTSSRARLGMGRTFQRMELFENMTAYENIELGFEASSAGANPLGQLIAMPRERREARERAADAIQLCGVDDLVVRRVRHLSTGQRRLVELARVLTGPFHTILLDEPSSGLDRTETDRFGGVLESVIATRDVAVLLVEHDMDLVMRICDHIHVLETGRLIAEGSPDAIQTDENVRSAYLGSTKTVAGGS